MARWGMGVLPEADMAKIVVFCFHLVQSVNRFSLMAWGGLFGHDFVGLCSRFVRLVTL
jgi:hypothetical protein